MARWEVFAAEDGQAIATYRFRWQARFKAWRVQRAEGNNIHTIDYAREGEGWVLDDYQEVMGRDGHSRRLRSLIAYRLGGYGWRRWVCLFIGHTGKSDRCRRCHGLDLDG